MSSGNIGRSSFVVGALVVFVANLGCHKETSHRVRHAKQHNNASPGGAEDEAPAAPPAPTANVVMPPPAAAPPPPLPPPAAAPRAAPSRAASRCRCRPVAPPAISRLPRPLARLRPSLNPRGRARIAPPGSRCEGGTAKGERLSVQGVAADDVLNVREAPDKAAAVLGGLPPDATGVRGTPNRRRVGASIWREVECGNLRGWVNERFLARDTGSQ